MALLSRLFFPSAALPLLASPLEVVGLRDDRQSQPARIVALWRSIAESPFHARLQPSRPTSWLFRRVRQLASPASPLTTCGRRHRVFSLTTFMVGLDGLVAGCMAVAISAPSFMLNAPWSLWALVGTLFGFLFWNWSPAKVFMWDLGSTSFGALFAALVLQASTWPEAFGYLLVATPLLADVCLCIPRRLLACQLVFQAHRLYLSQRLNQAGWTRFRVSLAYISAIAVITTAMLARGWLFVFSLAFAEVLLGVWLDQRVAVPFAVASKS